MLVDTKRIAWHVYVAGFFVSFFYISILENRTLAKTREKKFCVKHLHFSNWFWQIFSLFAESSLTSNKFSFYFFFSFHIVAYVEDDERNWKKKNNGKPRKVNNDKSKRERGIERDRKRKRRYQWFIGVKPFVHALMIFMNKSIFNNSRSVTSLQFQTPNICAIKLKE